MSIQELRKTVGEMQTKLDGLQTKLDGLQSKVNELQGKIGEDAEVLAEWQTASLVLCGAFSLISCKILT